MVFNIKFFLPVFFFYPRRIFTDWFLDVFFRPGLPYCQPDFWYAYCFHIHISLLSSIKIKVEYFLRGFSPLKRWKTKRKNVFYFIILHHYLSPFCYGVWINSFKGFLQFSFVYFILLNKACEIKITFVLFSFCLLIIGWETKIMHCFNQQKGGKIRKKMKSEVVKEN